MSVNLHWQVIPPTNSALIDWILPSKRMVDTLLAFQHVYTPLKTPLVIQRVIISIQEQCDLHPERLSFFSLTWLKVLCIPLCLSPRQMQTAPLLSSSRGAPTAMSLRPSPFRSARGDIEVPNRPIDVGVTVCTMSSSTCTSESRKENHCRVMSL